METERNAYRAHCLTIHKQESSIALETISDGYDEGGRAQAESIHAYLERFRRVGSQTLTQLLEKFCSSGCPVDCIVYDAFLPWALDIAKKFGLVGAVLFTQSCAVDNIYYHVHNGVLKVPLSETEILLPRLPPLGAQDMPSFIYDVKSDPAFFDMVVAQFSNVDKADWVLVNTFYELEQEVVDWMAKIWPLRTIGPTIPSMFLDKRDEDDKNYGFSIFKPNTNACMKWLNGCPKGESEEAKLPKNFVEETSKKGLVVHWCPQLEVLTHEAVGCFVTHCGWNSTLEALSFGVPMVAVPHWSDQSTNAKYIMDVWKIGLKASVDEKGLVKREAAEHCIREIMEGERGKEIKKNALKWRKLAKETVDEGGSSDKNIEEFVAKLIHS
ncbi:hypothetical protein SLA2020_365420 [Shorea laevis]